ncbi:MAG: hypothetical protein ACRCVJ_01030 [Clostridium sp.]|uniref:hypothetical protein n=1 Tax=Clostridium sp. TaxID=1506 RepID=UPI003F3B2C3D
MSKKNFNKNNQGNKTGGIENKEVPKNEEEIKPTHEKGNYVLSVVAEGEIIKKIAVAGAEIYVTKLADGGLTVDLK